jgi:hypothetical protein
MCFGRKMNSTFCFGLARASSCMVAHAGRHFEGARCAANGVIALVPEQLAGNVVVFKIGGKIRFSPISQWVEFKPAGTIMFQYGQIGSGC